MHGQSGERQKAKDFAFIFCIDKRAQIRLLLWTFLQPMVRLIGEKKIIIIAKNKSTTASKKQSINIRIKQFLHHLPRRALHSLQKNISNETIARKQIYL